jgi:hypothetical protein
MQVVAQLQTGLDREIQCSPCSFPASGRSVAGEQGTSVMRCTRTRHGVRLQRLPRYALNIQIASRMWPPQRWHGGYLPMMSHCRTYCACGVERPVRRCKLQRCPPHTSTPHNRIRTLWLATVLLCALLLQRRRSTLPRTRPRAVLRTLLPASCSSVWQCCQSVSGQGHALRHALGWGSGGVVRDLQVWGCPTGMRWRWGMAVQRQDLGLAVSAGGAPSWLWCSGVVQPALRTRARYALGCSRASKRTIP